MKISRKCLWTWSSRFGLFILTLEISGWAHADRVTYVYTDALGSVVAESDASGNITAQYEYAPYGRIVLGSSANGPGYTGHIQDPETDLVYMQQRYFDPQIGRFLGVDPVAVRQVGDNFNRYWYANNNPYRFKDPDGRDCVSAEGRTTCTPTKDGKRVEGLPVITFPTPKGWPSQMNSTAYPVRHHEYLYPTPIGNKSPSSVRNSVVNNPTPNPNDKPATPTGTANSASPQEGLRGMAASLTNNDVKSYSATDQNGNTWEINVTEPSHSLSPGYVLRGVVDNTLVTYGEGIGRLQMLGNVSDFAINDVWIDQNQQNIDEAK